MPEKSLSRQFMLPKAQTGIIGFDEITQGGLPKGRPTLICGSAGSGKTLFGMEFLVRGITQFDEPGVFVAFEESIDDLGQNVASLGFNLQELVDQKRLVIDHIHIDRSEAEQTGDYDLDGLFIRLDYAIQKVNAKRIVIDTLEILFGALDDTAILRSELQRLFRWLKDKGITAVITGERGQGILTRYGIEEYVSDCVILLDNRIENQISTRRLRVVKYRGSVHGANEYPFLIDETGFTVMPITSVGLEYPVSEERVSSGIPQLDQMFSGKGYFRGTTVLVSGTAGTGKSSFSASFVDAACRRGERCLYFAFEESANQIVRNMRSIGIDLQKWISADLLRIESARPTVYSLEMHLVMIYKHIQAFKPQAVIIDPVTNFDTISSPADVRVMLTRLTDFLKRHNITAILTSLSASQSSQEQTDAQISSVTDSWLLLRNVENNGERNRVLNILKSRGMDHSNQVSEYTITPNGIQLIETYLGPSGALTGSARTAQESSERAAIVARQQEIERKQLQMERKRIQIEAQITALEAELRIENEETQRLLDQLALEQEANQESLRKMARIRHVNSAEQTEVSEVTKEDHDRPT